MRESESVRVCGQVNEIIDDLPENFFRCVSFEFLIKSHANKVYLKVNYCLSSPLIKNFSSCFKYYGSSVSTHKFSKDDIFVNLI